jgi:hypothetical protein
MWHNEKKEVEAFVTDLMKYVEKLLPEEAHEMRWVVQRSVSQNPDAVKVHLLNCRYDLSKKGKVRKECEEFLDFLENAENRDWNETVKALAVQAEIEE